MQLPISMCCLFSALVNPGYKVRLAISTQSGLRIIVIKTLRFPCSFTTAVASCLRDWKHFGHPVFAFDRTHQTPTWSGSRHSEVSEPERYECGFCSGSGGTTQPETVCDVKSDQQTTSVSKLLSEERGRAAHDAPWSCCVPSGLATEMNQKIA